MEMRYNPNTAISYIQNTYPAETGQAFGDIQFRKNISGTFTTAMTIKGYSSYVGIGTTAPSEKLYLQSGNFRMFDPSSGANAGYQIQWASNAGGSDVSYALIEAITETNATRSGNLRFYTSSNGYPTERMRIGSDGAMAFNTSITGVRSYLFKALSGRQLAIEALESGGVHAIYLRPSSSGRNLIASNYFSGGVYLPLALSGRENDTDFVLQTNGNVSIGSSSDAGTKFQVNGANYVEMATFVATSASAAAIVSANAGYVQFANGEARHLSNSGVFTATTDGVQILKPGIVHITFSQDIITTTAIGYVHMMIRKNGTNISENLITNTNGQWDGINGVATASVSANDVIGFYVSGGDITSFDPGTWSMYSFIWSSR
jgi:hypothetical protein